MRSLAPKNNCGPHTTNSELAAIHRQRASAIRNEFHRTSTVHRARIEPCALARPGRWAALAGRTPRESFGCTEDEKDSPWGSNTGLAPSHEWIPAAAVRASFDPGAGSTAAARWVYGCRGLWKIVSTSACSTTLPMYITITSSVICATTPRLCVMYMIAMPNSCCRLRINLRICASVVTSSAVVGSSAISRLGWHESAIAITARWRKPAGKLVRVGIDALLGLRKADQIEHLNRLVARLGLVHLLVEHDGFHDLIADRVNRTERCHRFLRHERHLAAAEAAHRRAHRIEVGQVHAAR